MLSSIQLPTRNSRSDFRLATMSTSQKTELPFPCEEYKVSTFIGIEEELRTLAH
jgi:hypothetical protein